MRNGGGPRSDGAHAMTDDLDLTAWATPTELRAETTVVELMVLSIAPPTPKKERPMKRHVARYAAIGTGRRSYRFLERST